MTATSAAQAAAALGNAQSDSLVGLGALGKTGLALLAVIGLILVCAWLLRRLGAGPTRLGQHLRVLGSTALGQRERLVLVEVKGTWLVLGVTANQISKLHELPAPAAAAEPDASGLPAVSGGTFAERLTHALRHNLRRQGGGERPANEP